MMLVTSKLLPPGFSVKIFGFKLIGERRKRHKSRQYPVLHERREDFFGRLHFRTKVKVSSYLLAVLLIFTTFLAELLLEPYLPVRESPFLIYYVAVVIAAMQGGAGVGWFATLLAAVTTDFHFKNLGEAYTFTQGGYYLRLITFVFEGVFISILIDRLKSSQQQALLKADILRGSEQHLRNVLNSLFAFVGVMTTDGILVEVNQAALDLANLRIEDVVAKPFENAYWWSYSQESKIKLRRAIAKAAAGKMVRYDALLRMSKNQFITMDFSIAPIKNSEGRVVYLIPSGVDVTDRIKALQINKGLVNELENEKERIESIIESVPGVAWEVKNVRPDKIRFAFISDYLKPMTGYEPKELMKKGCGGLFDIIHPEDQEKFKNSLWVNNKKSKGGMERCRLITKSGKIIWVENRFVVYYDDNGIPVGAMGVTVDITDTQKLEMKKDEFVSIASHELKTPITTIKAFTQILEKRLQSSGDVESTYYLRKMNEYISKLTKIIYDFLDFSKIQAGKLEYAKEDIDISELVNEVVNDMQSTCESHKILKKGESEAIIEGDRTRISQVMINLISNAIKYSPEAKKVEVRLEDNSHNVIIRVKDFGIGISDEGQKKLFERFYRVSNPKKIRIEGFGLGLYISKEIIKRHGGDIGVDSEVGKGSTFTVHLPIKRPKSN